ncbi:hypothetical protein Tco_0721336 [Tanacetum coccineum]
MQRRKEDLWQLTMMEMPNRRNDVKARTTLLLALPDEHQLRFNKYDNAKELWEAILKTFSGNEATKNDQRRIRLKQQYATSRQSGLGKDFLMQNKAYYKCGYFDHLASNCGIWVDKGETWPMDNYSQNNVKFPSTHKSMTPRAVLLKSGSKPIVAAKNQIWVPKVPTGRTKIPTVGSNVPTAKPTGAGFWGCYIRLDSFQPPNALFLLFSLFPSCVAYPYRPTLENPPQIPV